MNRIDRLFGMLTVLQSKKYVTAEQLSEQFGISVRTVYRDVKALGAQIAGLGTDGARSGRGARLVGQFLGKIRPKKSGGEA